MLLIIEDLHWSDDTSLELLRYLARRLTTRPVLFLLTYRSDEVHPSLQHFLAELSREQHPAELALARFTPTEVDALLRAIFDQERPVRVEFLDALMNLTGGNPFFIEEVLKALIAAGDLFCKDGAWERKPIDELRIPHSIQDAVQRRVAQLSEDAQQTLTVAAVAGRHFDFGVLQAITTCTEAELLRQIKELLAAQLVVEVSTDHFSFRHALTQQAIYSALLGRERQIFHQQIGETLERSTANNGTTHAMDPTNAPGTGLAYHFYAAGVWEKALTYARRAAEHAQALYSPRAAIEQFTRALAAAQQLNDAALLPDLHRARGLAYETVGDFALAQSDLETVLQLARDAADRQMEWRALVDLGKLWASRDYTQTGSYFQAALALARTLDDPNTLARTLNRMGNWHLNVEEPLKAVRYHEEALAIFEALNDRRGLATTSDLLGMTGWIGADFRQGRRYFERAVTLFNELGDRQGLVLALVGIVGCGSDISIDTAVYASTTFADCEPQGKSAVKIAREIGWRSTEAFALQYLGICQGAQGKYTEALQCIHHSLEIAIEIEHRQWLTAAHRNLGLFYLDLLAFPTAQPHLEQAIALAHEIRSPNWIRLVTGLFALAFIQQNDLVQAETTLNTLADIDTPPQTIGLRVLWRARAELALARGELDLALEITDRLLISARHGEAHGQGATPALAKLRGEILTAYARWPEAEAELQAALKVATTQGARPLLWRIQTALGRLYQAQQQSTKADQAFAAARAIVNEIAAMLTDPELRDNFVQQAHVMITPAQASTPLKAAKQVYEGLTRREREVAALIAQGKSNRAIADVLVLGVRTIEGHVSNILGKLGFTSRTEIAVWAVEKGL